jgi:outer membrane lipoprotein SlyB
MAKARHDYDQVSAIFASYADFASLIETLNLRGYREDDISVLMSESTHRQYFAPQENTKAPEGATVGSLSGGILGALVGGLTAAGSIVIPGAGLVVAGLSAGAVGAVTGGLIGALVGAGIPEHEAKFFENALKEQGRILVVAHVPKAESDEVKSVFERCNAQRLKVHTC